MGAQHSSDEFPLMDRSVPCEAWDLEQSWVSPFARVPVCPSLEFGRHGGAAVRRVPVPMEAREPEP